MHICLIVEGCYPYIVGGVSSWVQSLITNVDEHEFSLIVINPEKKIRGQFKYDIPDNVKDIQEVFFDELSEVKGKWNKKVSLKHSEYVTLKALLNGENISWPTIFEMFLRFKSSGISPVDFILSKPFYQVLQNSYEERYNDIPFTEVFWTLRSIYIPLFTILENDYIEADVYHCVSTGYGGIIGAFLSYTRKKTLILTEHGIYTREREEELIKSDWVAGRFKDIWIRFFKMLSDAAYEEATIVISLFKESQKIQIELGCKMNKTKVIHNGVKLEMYEDGFISTAADNPVVTIAGVVRIVPIKDIFTMLKTFSIIEKQRDNVRFIIIGPTDEDEEYYEECLLYMKELQLKNVEFTGRVNIKNYLKDIDIHILTSISEGQPLSVLETLACRIPNITTYVGDCASMIYGEDDEYGQAGACANVMDVEGLVKEVIKLIDDKELRIEYGINGYKRVANRYTFASFIDAYKEIYYELS